MFKEKNIYLALILTFIFTGLGSIYAGNLKKGAVLLAARIIFAVVGLFLSIFLIFSMLVWAYGFYAAYRDVRIANGHANPRILEDWKSWNQMNRAVCVIVVLIVLIFTVSGVMGVLSFNGDSSYSDSNYYSGDSDVHYYSGGSGSSSGHSHYGGVDTFPETIARDDPDWYYDHYEYGDFQDIDDYLESEGFD